MNPDEAKFVVVPVEPTGQMIEAAERLDAEWRRRFSGLTTGATVGEVYKAMLRARPVAAPLREALAELVKAQGRMRDKWAEGDENVKRDLWRNLHEAGDRARALLEDK